MNFTTTSPDPPWVPADVYELEFDPVQISPPRSPCWVPADVFERSPPRSRSKVYTTPEQAPEPTVPGEIELSPPSDYDAKSHDEMIRLYGLWLPRTPEDGEGKTEFLAM